MNKKKLFTYLILVMFATTFIPLFSNTVGADSWTKWQTITVSNPDNNCQVFLNVSYDADMKADFGDVHFTKLDNTTELDYWMEQKVNSDWAWFWVELPADIEGTPNFNMLYGDASSTTLSNGANTFEWFDDFTDNVTHIFDSVQGTPDNQFFVNDTGLTLTTNYGVWYKFNSTDYTSGTNHVQIIIGTSDDDMSGTDKVADGTHFGLSTGSTSGANATNQDYFISGREGNTWVWSGGSTSDVHIPYTADRQKLLHWKINSTRAINFSLLDSDDHTYYTSTFDDNNPNPPTNWSIPASHPNLNCKYLYFHTDDDAGTATHSHTTIDGNGYKYFKVQDGTQKIGQYYDYVFITEEPDTPPSLSFGSEGTRGEGTYDCSATDDEEGDWEFSECARNGTLDEAWYEDNSDSWIIYDRSSEWSENRSYSHWDPTGTAGINTTFINSSGMNRSQLIVNIHHNGSLPLVYTNSSAGFVYQDCTGNQLYLLQGQGIATYALYYNKTTETYWDLGTHKLINITNVNSSNLTNWGNSAPVGVYEVEGEAMPYYWETAPHGANGSWLKSLVNILCENISFKAWGDPTLQGLMKEPAGWIIHYNDTDWTNIFTCNYACIGLAVWNPEGEKVRWDFDILNVFQENFTLNTSRVTDFYTQGTPYWQFPIVDASTYYVNLYEFFNETTSGNMSAEDLINPLRNITNASEVNSRPYTPDDGLVDDEPWEQYDYNRIYTTTLTNMTLFGFAYDDYLWVYLHSPTYGDGASGTQNAQTFIAIDVDGNDSWDTNDRAYYTDSLGNKWEWHGSAPAVFSITANTWFTEPIAYQNIHRYWGHSQSSYLIPLSHLVKSNGHTLNSSDIFNITAFTWQAIDSNICFLNNYNESACQPIIPDTHDSVKLFFLNETTLEETGTLDINGTNIARWAQGQIVGAKPLGDSPTYDFTLEKTVNETAVSGEHSYYLLNYSLYINNTGTGTLTDIYINETWHECVCSDFKWTIDSISVANSTYDDWHNASCYWIIHNASWSLGQGENLHIWYVMNVTNCTGNLSGYIYNNVTANCTGIGTDGTDSVYTIFGVQASRVRIRGEISYPDLIGTGNSVFNVIAIVMIIGSILMIIGVMRRYGMI